MFFFSRVHSLLRLLLFRNLLLPVNHFFRSVSSAYRAKPVSLSGVVGDGKFAFTIAVCQDPNRASIRLPPTISRGQGVCPSNCVQKQRYPSSCSSLSALRLATNSFSCASNASFTIRLMVASYMLFLPGCGIILPHKKQKSPDDKGYTFSPHLPNFGSSVSS